MKGLQMNFLKRVGFVLVGIMFSFSAFAGKYNLIEKDGSGSLAKSHKSLGAGKHEFVLDETKKLSGGKDVTYDFLKKSLEEKLASVYGVKVTGDAKKIVVSYEGEEKAFLAAVASTKIRTKFKTALAQTDMGGDTGIRAQKKGAAAPAPDEVYGTVVKITKDYMQVAVLKVGGKGKTNEVGKKPVKILPIDGKFKKGDGIYFVPSKKMGDKWIAKKYRKN